MSLFKVDDVVAVKLADRQVPQVGLVVASQDGRTRMTLFSFLVGKFNGADVVFRDSDVESARVYDEATQDTIDDLAAFQSSFPSYGLRFREGQFVAVKLPKRDQAFGRVVKVTREDNRVSYDMVLTDGTPLSFPESAIEYAMIDERGPHKPAPPDPATLVAEDFLADEPKKPRLRAVDWAGRRRDGKPKITGEGLTEAHLVEVIAEHGLTDHGFGQPQVGGPCGFPKLDGVLRILPWLQARGPVANVCRTNTSYSLKHRAEPEVGYVSNGEFLAAAYLAGFKVERCPNNSPNGWINIEPPKGDPEVV